MRRRMWLVIGGILLLTAAAAFSDVHNWSVRAFKSLQEVKVREGLDLQGGSHLVYQADFSKLGRLSDSQRADKLNQLKQAIERRVNAFGVGETSIQTAKVGSSYRIIAELPGVKNTDQAKSQIGRTAQLHFYEITPDGHQGETAIHAEDLSSATAGYDSQSNAPIISFTLKGAATRAFADLTTRINQEGGRLLTTLDTETIFGPATVSTPILNGQGQMTGFKDITDAQTTATLLNAGALPVPINLVEERTVGPTLGAESVHRSIVAGIIGLIIVMLYMAFYYRLPGLVADLALSIYALLVFAVFKGALFWLGIPPITLTLAGVAGFILSIGMAVDANILIFERFKEEVRSGKQLTLALEAGFDRAWTSIRDSNISTLITSSILYYFGTGPIRGFALTLGIGVLISMFTAIVVTRTLLRLVIRPRMGERLSLFAVKADEVSR